MPKTRRNFSDAVSLQRCIDGYFSMCDAHTSPVAVGRGKGAGVIDAPDPLPYTFTRLAIACGCTAATLKAIMVRGLAEPDGLEGDLAEILQFARLRIEANLEERMLRGLGFGQGHIFALKNHYGWRDTVGITSEEGGPLEILVRYAEEKAPEDPASNSYPT